MLLLTIQIRDERGGRLEAEGVLNAILTDGSPIQIDGKMVRPGELQFASDHMFVLDSIWLFPRETGHWDVVLSEVPQGPVIIPSLNGLPWWLDDLNLACSTGNPASHLKIGVIDACFGFDSNAHFIDIFGRSVRPEPGVGRWGHGEAVLGLLSDGLAANAAAVAEIICVELGGRAEQRVGSELISSALFQLIRQEVDIICMSWGTFASMDPYSSEYDSYCRDVRELVDLAFANGILCVFAAGNDPTSDGAAFPARLDNAVGVSTYGDADWGPEATTARFYAEDAEETGHYRDREVFAWSSGTFGPGVDMVAPGVGLILNRDGVPAYALAGSSFANPLVAALLSIDLARDSGFLKFQREAGRANYMKQRLESRCRSLGMDRRYEAKGVPVL